jgi:flavodoxin
LQEREYKGEVKDPAQQISLGLEILGETVEIDGKETPRLLWTKPANIFWQLTEKGNELALYKVFNPAAEPDTEADWDAQLGKPCNIVISHTKGKGENKDKVYDNIATLTPIPIKYQKGVAAATMTPCIGDADDEDNEATKALYGLSHYIWAKRIDESSEEDDDLPSNQQDDDLDDEEVPF